MGENQATKPQETKEQPKEVEAVPVVAAVLGRYALAEQVYDAEAGRCAFAVWQDGSWRMENSVKTANGEKLVPYSPTNNLIRNKVVLFPSEPVEYGSQKQLIRDIRNYIHRYCDLSPRFERIASYYVLFSWVHDAFNELAYLRVRGHQFGSGKTRFLLTVGALCYRPIFASGGSTVSPIFHMLDRFRGATLILDEADFRLSDAKADIVKILNNGNVRGVPVLRTMMNRNKEFDPRAFQVFGPKMIATRGLYEDRALESRFITEETSGRGLRKDIPINLPKCYEAEALALRNKLLLYRFRHFGRLKILDTLVDRTVDPRLNQVFVPLLSIIEDEGERDELAQVMRDTHRDQVAERGTEVEGQILTVIRCLMGREGKSSVSIGEVRALFEKLHGADYEGAVSSRWVGSIVRQRLAIKTQKSNGNYCVGPSEHGKLEQLYKRYGVSAEDAGAVPTQ